MAVTSCSCCGGTATHIILVCATHKTEIEKHFGFDAGEQYSVATYEVELID